MLKKEVIFGVFIVTRTSKNEKFNSAFIYRIKYQFLYGSILSFP